MCPVQLAACRPVQPTRSSRRGAAFLTSSRATFSESTLTFVSCMIDLPLLMNGLFGMHNWMVHFGVSLSCNHHPAFQVYPRKPRDAHRGYIPV